MVISHDSSSHLIKFDFRIPMDICIPFTKWYRVILAIHPILWDDEACFSWGVWTKSSMTIHFFQTSFDVKHKKANLHNVHDYILAYPYLSTYQWPLKWPHMWTASRHWNVAPLHWPMAWDPSTVAAFAQHGLIGSENRSCFWMAFWDGGRW